MHTAHPVAVPQLCPLRVRAQPGWPLPPLVRGVRRWPDRGWEEGQRVPPCRLLPAPGDLGGLVFCSPTGKGSLK